MKTYIPFEARIMALADVFDALVSKRVYKENFDFDKAFTIVSESSGTHFDPELCEDFLECRPLLEELYSTYDRQFYTNDSQLKHHKYIFAFQELCGIIQEAPNQEEI